MSAEHCLPDGEVAAPALIDVNADSAPLQIPSDVRIPVQPDWLSEAADRQL